VRAVRELIGPLLDGIGLGDDRAHRPDPLLDLADSLRRARHAQALQASDCRRKKECKEEGEDNRDKSCRGEIQNRPHGEEGEQRGCLHDSAIDTHDIPRRFSRLRSRLPDRYALGVPDALAA
jgi:hypothetical protein